MRACFWIWLAMIATHVGPAAAFSSCYAILAAADSGADTLKSAMFNHITDGLAAMDDSAGTDVRILPGVSPGGMLGAVATVISYCRERPEDRTNDAIAHVYDDVRASVGVSRAPPAEPSGNYCKDPQAAAEVLEAFNIIFRKQFPPLEAIDIEGIRPISRPNTGSPDGCRGVFILTTGGRLSGAIEFRMNVANQPIVIWVPEKSTNR